MNRNELVKEIASWKAERDKAIRSQDVKTFKAFYEKWKAKAYYDVKLPSDYVLEVSLRKMLYNMENATVKEKEQAKKWLIERGFDTNVN